VESLKTKASKAAEIAISLTKEKQAEKSEPKPTPLKETSLMKPQVQVSAEA